MELHYRLSRTFMRIVEFFLRPIYWLYSCIPIAQLPALEDENILLQSASSIAKKIRSKQLSSEVVVKAFIKRCRKVNPILNAIVEERYEAALIEARRVDSFIQTTTKSLSEIEGDTPFLGVPFTVKESCALEGMSFSVGSRSRVGERAEKDGDAVKNMRSAGGIPIAVTNTPEMCSSFETSNYLTGFTRNPYDRHRTSGGSSGGEAALISSGASVIGVASDFNGAIRVPALFTGIFGHKPTPGIISTFGHFPYLSSSEFLKYFTIGIMARYAEDLQPALLALAGEKGKQFNFDQKVNLKDLKVYYIMQASDSIAYPPVETQLQQSIIKASYYLFRKYGCPVKKVYYEELKDSYEISISLITTCDGAKSLMQLADKETNMVTETMKAFLGFSEFTVEYMIFRFLVKATSFISEKRRKFYVKQRDDLRKKLCDLLGDNGILIYPTFSSQAFYKKQPLLKLSGAMYPAIFNVLGFPATHVPLGLHSNKLPLGVQVIAAPNQDRLCLAVARELEDAFGGWTPPPFEPKDLDVNGEAF